ncbi:MAG: hypothetical protein U9O96_03440 [Candidatus Thermoplasmatota archaeon]|nr:hypothetical protein [Candidatus Thermoplasmatota archaeon]
MGKFVVLIAIIVLISCSTQLSHLSDADDTSHWEVKWYKIYNTVNNSTFRVFVGSESWDKKSFYYNWDGYKVYENYTDNIGFEATALIHSEGGEYELRLYDVDDYAWVTVDGKEMLRVEKDDKAGEGIVKLNNPLRLYRGVEQFERES